MKHYCIINTQYEYVTDKLKAFGFDCISTEKSPNVSEPISYHADVLYLKISSDSLKVSSCQKNNIAFLESLGFDVHTEQLGAGYKNESKLNMVITDNMIICNPKTCIETESFKKGKQILNVKQGYTKCSTVVIGNDNFITEDISILKALSEAGKNCLLVNKGYVELQGYDYGFIGGASVYLEEKNLLLFFGDISRHPDYIEIAEFCKHIGVEIDYIKDYNLTDIGGAICI